MSELLEVKGLGPSKAAVLEEADIKTIDKLAIQSPLRIKTILDCSINAATKLVNEAQSMMQSAIVVETAEDVIKDREQRILRIPTGVSALDQLIGGGIETDALTAFTGEFGTGKSEFCCSVLLNNDLRFGRKSAWIETEPQTFRGERLVEIANARGVKFDPSSVFVVRSRQITNTSKQYMAYEAIEKYINRGNDVGVIVIDSFNARFRAEFTERTMLAPRSAATAQHLGFLQYLASEYNIAIIMTMQVMGIPDAGSQLGSLKKMGIRYKPVGPHVLKHGVNYWLSVDHVSSSGGFTGKVVIADAPVARGECEFNITAAGVGDVSNTRGRAN